MDGSRAQFPWHLWAVGLSVVLLHGWGACFGLWFLFTGAIGPGIHVIWLVGLWAAVLGGIALLLQRKEARLLFAVVLLAAAASAVSAFLGAAEGIWPPVIIVNCVFLLLGGGLPLLYARAMVRGGVLR